MVVKDGGILLPLGGGTVGHLPSPKYLYGSRGWGNSFLSGGDSRPRPPPSLYIAGDEIVGRGDRIGGSSILYIVEAGRHRLWPSKFQGLLQPEEQLG